MVLKIRDNGVGDQGTTSLGIGKMLVNVLARQLSTEVTTTADAGTTVRIRLPERRFSISNAPPEPISASARP